MTFLDVLRCIAPLFSRELQTFNLLNNPVNLRHTKVDKSKLVCNNPVNSRHTKLDKSKVGLGWLEWAGWAGFWDVLGRFWTFLDVFGDVFGRFDIFASLFSRQVQTCLKQSCQFASYKTRQVQSWPGLAWAGLDWAGLGFGTF